jgi:hypothetical protein
MAVSGTLTSTGAGDRTGVSGAFNASLTGTFAATLRLERSFDGGATYEPLTALGTAITFTGPCSETFEEPEADVRYRWNCTSYTSGTIQYRISQ